ncbi:MAG: methylmalonyl-CoA mutase [Chryseobacterium sp. SCN 40-13]|nr:MAG: methylmalonyl-CoA mutase [Chryseobacterium sp. SCN 40-13]
MLKETSVQDWENLVKKQLKTEDINAVLSRQNLEGIEVKPYYGEPSYVLKNLPKVEENTHLVALYHEEYEEEVRAFLLNQNVEGLEDKTLFINNKDLAEHISPEETDEYFSLIDVFDEDGGSLDEQLAKEMLAKDFRRNLCIDVALHQNAGASIVQQLGIALAKTKELTEIFGKDILSKILFRVAVGGNYFFEIAKIRALKLVFHEFSKEFDTQLIPYIFAETTLRNKSNLDEENNLIRSTLELSAAMIGSADAVFSNDYKLENQTLLSEEISFKQQIVLAYESIINVFDDAANGSYFVEEITRQFAEKSWKYFLEIEEKGGYLAMLQSGEIQKHIFQHAVAEQNWVEEGKIKLTGINLYPQREKTKTVEEMYSGNTIKPVRLAEMFE